MFITCRAIAVAIVSAATLAIPAQSAAADPDAGTAVVITGDDYYVSADSVTIHHNPTKHSAVVEIAHRGDTLTVDRTHVAGIDAGPPGAGWWLEATNRRTGAHGYLPQARPAPEPTAAAPEAT
ncbi:hypothetical protein, partial [Streptomyces sp. SID3343]|uniref:hypothetical protein n=1 Tax=Streptomyces sp. SID3343 TaxID=2690260 RepID=UPI00136A7197